METDIFDTLEILESIDEAIATLENDGEVIFELDEEDE